MVRQIFRFEILPPVLYVGFLLLISWRKIASLVSRHGFLDVSAARDARDIFPVTLVISQHVEY